MPQSTPPIVPDATSPKPAPSPIPILPEEFDFSEKVHGSDFDLLRAGDAHMIQGISKDAFELGEVVLVGWFHCWLIDL